VIVTQSDPALFDDAGGDCLDTSNIRDVLQEDLCAGS
jgi:hypothetical protein